MSWALSCRPWITMTLVIVHTARHDRRPSSVKTTSCCLPYARGRGAETRRVGEELRGVNETGRGPFGEPAQVTVTWPEEVKNNIDTINSES